MRERLRTAAALAHRAYPPILVTGGIVESPDAKLEGWPGGDVALAEVTADALEKEFSLTQRWVEADRKPPGKTSPLAHLCSASRASLLSRRHPRLT
jgi:hypothetical protein